MVTTLDQRFQTFVKELAQKNNVQYTNELKDQLTENIVIGYNPSNTWDNAEKIITERFHAMNQKVA